MKVYFVRHGQTDNNAKKMFQFPETPLSEIGLEQARFVARRFRDVEIDRIISSPFIRARQTAEIIGSEIEKNIDYNDLLIECLKPTVIRGKDHGDEEAIKIVNLIKENVSDPSWHHSDEENFWDIKKRATEFITFLEQQLEENILIVTHSEILCTIITSMMMGEDLTVDIRSKFIKFFKIINTGVTICEKTESGWEMKTWNDHAHLP